VSGCEEVWIMSDDEDEFVAELERRIAPLRDEADALIDDVLREVEREAVVVLLPGRSVAPEVVEVPPRRWIWLSAAAALLLTMSTLVLAAEGRRRIERPAIQVGGDAEPRARVRVGVADVTSDTRASRWNALVELRSLHRPLAACAAARDSSEPVALTIATRLRVDDAARPDEVRVDEGELDEPTRACLVRTVSDWHPLALGNGELNLLLEIER
jgi:hypothetical protein